LAACRATAANACVRSLLKMNDQRQRREQPGPNPAVLLRCVASGSRRCECRDVQKPSPVPLRLALLPLAA
jgi:hypothetical protein